MSTVPFTHALSLFCKIEGNLYFLRVVGKLPALILLTVELSCLSACGGSAGPQLTATKLYTSSTAYQGAPLHAPPPTTVFPQEQSIIEGTLPPSLTASLDAAADSILKDQAVPALSAAVGIPGQGMWSMTRGFENISPRKPLSDQAYFWWASVGKTFTATVTMKLIEEHKLQYEDKLSTWFPTFPNAGVITINQLLTHTSGISSFQEGPDLESKQRYHPPSEAINLAATHGSDFQPGQHWMYNNTGYILLAQIIEKIEGKPFHEVIQEKIIAPLHLKHTVALAPRQILEGLAIVHDAQFGNLELSSPYGAANIASRADDMITFWNALLTGRILDQATVQQAFSTLYPMSEARTEFYGRGMMLFDFHSSVGAQYIWLGHTGSHPGVKSLLVYDIADKVFYALALNSDVQAGVVVGKLVEAVKQYRQLHTSLKIPIL